MLQGQPGLITHRWVAVVQEGMQKGFHHGLLAGFDQVGIEAPQRPSAVAAHRRLAVDPQTLQQLSGGRIGLGRTSSTGIGQGAGGPKAHGGHIQLKGADQWVEDRGIGVVTQAPGHRLAHVTVVVDLQQA